jgi:hypothetical protein
MRRFALLTNRSPRRLRRLVAVAGVGSVVAAAGCMSLDVTNTDVPEIKDVLSSGSNLESTVGLSFRNFWGVTQGSRTNATYPVVQLGALAELITGTAAATWEVIQEPRQRYDNVGAGQWVNRKPWYDLYEVIATEADALRAIKGGVKVGTVTAAAPNGTDTPRAQVFGRFMIGAAHAYIGIMFDQGFTVDETTDLAYLNNQFTAADFREDFHPYPEVATYAVNQLTRAIADAKAGPNFTLPLEWVNQQTISRDELVRIMNGYVLRTLVYTARTPAERAAVDWTRVLELTAPGNVITKDFGALADASKSGTTSALLQYTQLMTDARTDNMLIGPADTSGAYQKWLATPFEQRAEIQILTPDRRIHGAGGPATTGTYFQYQTAAQTMSNVRGTAPFSRYKGVRYGTNYYQTGFIPTMTLVEMDLLRAEALIRLGRAAEAVALINKTRVTNGQLPPVTAAGTGTKPSCVPRKDNGDCGDLLDAMLYEKRIELQAVEGILHWADWRAFGKLARGSLLQLPVHGRELQTLGLEIYSFGGDLPGSAP